GVLVLLAVAVPVELDLDAAVLVAPDLLAAGSDDEGILGSLHLGFGSGPSRPKLLAALQRAERAGIGGGRVSRGLVGVVTEAVFGTDNEVLAILVTARSIGQVEEPTDGDVSHVALSLGTIELGVELVDPRANVVVALVDLDVLARVIE